MPGYAWSERPEPKALLLFGTQIPRIGLRRKKWDVGGGAGIQQYGAKNMPSDGKPEHKLQYTPAGREKFLANKPGWGETEVYASQVNDPVDRCDPAGFPRADLLELAKGHPNCPAA
jgi:hypothetical protein